MIYHLMDYERSDDDELVAMNGTVVRLKYWEEVMEDDQSFSKGTKIEFDLEVAKLDYSVHSTRFSRILLDLTKAILYNAPR